MTRSHNVLKSSKNRNQNQLTVHVIQIHAEVMLTVIMLFAHASKITLGTHTLDVGRNVPWTPSVAQREHVLTTSVLIHVRALAEPKQFVMYQTIFPAAHALMAILEIRLFLADQHHTIYHKTYAIQVHVSERLFLRSFQFTSLLIIDHFYLFFFNNIMLL